MTKLRFLLLLQDRLSGLPQDDVEERLNFYSEMIEDRMEEGLSEEEAVAAVGAIDEIAAQIVADIPAAKEKVKGRRQLKAWGIVLLALGSPIWISLLVAGFVVILSIYISLWSMIVSLWAAFASLVACGFSVVVVGIAFALGGNGLTGVAMIGAGIVSAGLSIFLFYGCKSATKGTILIAKNAGLGIKNCFVKGGSVNE